MTNPPPNNPAPGEGRLSFDSPEVQTVLQSVKNDPDDWGYPAALFADALTAEHDARVAAEEELERIKSSYRVQVRDLANERDGLRGQIAAAESANASLKVSAQEALDYLRNDLKLQQEIAKLFEVDESGEECIKKLKDCIESLSAALAPAPTAAAAGSDASTEGRTA